jgi:tetratricopeptide (TPR) repeat protein
VAETIEKLFVDHLENQIDVLARHYFWSDRLERALHYLILAGQKAAHNYNTSQAQKYFEDALSLLPNVKHTPQQELQVHVGLGDALALAGNYPETRAAYERAFLVIARDEKSNAEMACSLQRKIAMTHEAQGDYDQALICLAAARKLLLEGGIDSPAELSQILNDIGWIYFRRSNLDEAENYLMQAQKLAEKAARLDIVSSVYNRLGGVHYQKDQLKESRDFVAKSIAIREDLGDILGVARSYNNLGNLSWKLGDWDEALDNFKRSAELQARLGDIEGIIMLNGNLGLLQIDRGYTKEARQYLEDALSQAEQIGHNFHIALTNHYLSVLFNALGEWTKTLDYSLRSEALLKNLSEKATLVDVYVNRGSIYLGMYDLPKAVHCAKQAMELLTDFTMDADTEIKGTALRLLGDIALAMHNIDEAKNQYRQAELIFDATGNRLERGRLMISMARLAVLQSDPILVKSYLALAQKLFEQLGARLDVQKLDGLKKNLALESQG